MRPETSRELFLKELGYDIANLTVENATNAMINFYKLQRVEGCDIENDGDMLLWQWGNGRKSQYRFELTRQFILDDECEPFQLSLCLYFDNSSRFLNIEDGNEWCGTPLSVDEFYNKILNSTIYEAVNEMVSTNVTLTYEQC
ncbi:hypothetical protein [Shewanella decolorationis]|uniref:hypothetical protein n=1 Tax=Shewanella decolorationis TaxID=256839 RepID=UPI0010575B39|nr:hypothetical protein [Shewanella decolorationis]